MMNNKGQSTIEFILGFSFTLGILFVFISLGMNYGVGYLNHYATFMASRTYMVTETSSFDSGTSYREGLNQGRSVYQNYNIEKFGARNVSLKFNQITENVVKPYIGAYSTFSRPLSAFRPLGGGVSLTMLSESFLGREPTRNDCFQGVCEALTGSIDGCNQNIDVTVFDNGC